MKSKVMKRWLLTIWILGICLTGFAQAGSTPLLVKGTVDVPYVEEVGLYRSIDGFWECVAKAKLMDGKYLFALDAPQTELLAVGLTTNTATKQKAVFCGKNGDRISMNIKERMGNYSFEGEASNNNRVLEAWEREYQQVLPDNDIKNTWKVLYPKVDGFMKASKDYAAKVKSEDADFDALLKLFIETQAWFGLADFHFQPSLEFPTAEERLPLLASLAENVPMNTPLYAKLPMCGNLLFMIPANQKVVGKPDWSVDSASEAVQRVYFLTQLRFGYYKTYDEFMADYEKYGKSVTDKKQLAQIEDYKQKNGYTATGKSAIDFTYPDRNGKQVSLSDFKGKVVVVDVWATWCGPCKAEIPHLKKLEKEFEGRDDIVFLGVSVDKAKDKEKWLKMIDDEQMAGIHLFADGFSEITKSYQITGIPRFMVFDKQGNIVSTNAPRPSNPQLKTLLLNELKK